MITKIAVTLLTCFGFFFANGQIKKNSTLLGGQVFYYGSNIDYLVNQPNQKSKTATFNISIGKAFRENNVYGLNITYAPSNFDNLYNGVNYISTKGNQYNFGVFNRKYKKLGKDFYFFAEFGAAYNYSKRRDTDTLGVKLETIKQFAGQLFLTPGVSYKILNKVHLEIIIPNIVTIEYAVTKNQAPAGNTKQSQFLFNSSLNSYGTNLMFLGVGFHFIL